MFCPHTGVDCIETNCLMWDRAEDLDADGNQIGPEQSCLLRVKVEAEIDFYNIATQVLEEGLPGLPQPAETPPVTKQEEAQPSV